jgi:hypothetical protein
MTRQSHERQDAVAYPLGNPSWTWVEVSDAQLAQLIDPAWQAQQQMLLDTYNARIRQAQAAAAANTGLLVDHSLCDAIWAEIVGNEGNTSCTHG